MATSTLIQFIDAGESASTSHRSQEETFLAGGAIAAGDWVSLDTTQTGADKALYVIEAAGGAAGSGLPCGVALEAAASGEQVRVCIAGYCASASVLNAVAAAGVPLRISATAGAADAATGGAEAVIGTSLAAAAANVAEVWVYKRF
jgi:hypothetical protein